MENIFTKRVRKVVSDIPKGETLTYKKVAELAGSPGAARAVGNVMKNNYNKDIPCHRVVRSDGGIGGYNRGGSSEKIKKLKKEGIPFI
jgi:methylated-DNA-[protein]-cysteine S-methyltransferase